MGDIQKVYEVNQQEGFVGDCARPEEYQLYEYDKVTGADVMPGYGVYWDDTNNEWLKPTNQALELDVIGIVSFDPAYVATRPDPIPAGVNSGTSITIKDGSIVKVATAGAFFAIAGEALSPNDIVVFNHDDNKWEKISITQGAHSDIPSGPSAGDLFRFDQADTTYTGLQDIDGSTTVTSIEAGHLFRRVGSNWVRQLDIMGQQKKSVYAITSAPADGLVVLRFSPSILR